MATDDLPRGWSRQRVSDVAVVIMGTSPKGHTYNREGKGTPLLNGPTEFGPRHPTPVQWTTSPNRVCETGDILFCVRGSTTGRMNWADQAYCLGRGLAAIRAIPGRCLPEFLRHFLATQTDEVLRKGEGGVFPNFNKPQIERMEVPLPALQEQRRIVTRIEQLTTRIQQAADLHREATQDGDRLLHVNVESVFVEIKSAARAPLQTMLVGKPRNGWSPPADSHADAGVPVLILSAVTGFRYDGSKIKWTAAQTREDAHYWLKPRELLITRSNTPELVGHAAIYDGTPARCICPDLIMKMAVDPKKADLRFIHYWLQTTEARSFITSRARGTSGSMKKIKQGDVQEIPVPQVSVTDQAAVVRRLDSFAQKAERLISQQEEIRSHIDVFMPALLAKAFRGDL